MPNVKVANPASHLLLVNGGHKMKKRRKSTARRRKANPSHSAKRVVVRVNGRRGKRVNARRRRNPSFNFSILKDAGVAAIGSGLTTVVRSFVPINVGGALGDAGLTAAVAYGLGVLTDKFISGGHGKMITIGGVAVAVNNLLNNYGLAPQQLLAPRPQPVAVKVATPTGMQDIVALRAGTYDPYYGTTPRFGPVGMGDIVTRKPSPTY